MSELNKVFSCPECNSTALRWHCTQGTYTGATIVDGRLRLHDFHTVFYLSCESCSETLKVVDGDEVAEYLTNKVNE